MKMEIFQPAISVYWRVSGMILQVTSYSLVLITTIKPCKLVEKSPQKKGEIT